MQPESCQHLLNGPPDLVTVAGVSFLVSQCVKCGCGIAFRLDKEGEVEGITTLQPPQQKAA